MHMKPKEIVQEFWKTMQTNDFYAASQWFSADYELLWPLSSEKIIGAENFAELNANYPANGTWQFTIHRLVAEGNQVVSDVTVTDGVVQARAITFSTVEDGKITRQIEYWPEPYTAPEWRKQWVVPLN